LFEAQKVDRMNVTPVDENLLLLISTLFYSIEQSAIRAQACEQVMAAHAPNLVMKVNETEGALRGSVVQKRFSALRERAIQAVQDDRLSELGGLVGEVSSLTRTGI
jgi:hypothetical protein